ncbi:MAG: transposase [Candidatus Endonucleobacter sp. (ex Gigantidas childressi)]|nr:transposase [Candidatus Endonucleobacter sp. (ex Gigantidas childressi)]
MQKSFTTQPKLFVSASDLSHPILRNLDDTKALLKWSDIVKLLSSIYASNTGSPSYPLLTLFRALLIGTWYSLSDVQLAQCLYIPVAFQVDRYKTNDLMFNALESFIMADKTWNVQYRDQSRWLY